MSTRRSTPITSPATYWRRGAIGAVAAAALALAGAPGASAGQPSVAVPANGPAQLAWDSGQVATQHQIGTATWAAGASPEPAQFVSAATDYALRPEVAANDAGDAVLSWTRIGPDTGPPSVKGRRRGADGTLGPTLSISAPYPADESQVAMAPDGSAIFVWTRGGSLVHARRLSADGALGPILHLSPAGYQSDVPDVAMDADGNALVTWRRWDVQRDTAVVQARRIAADGTLGARQTLSIASTGVEDPHVAIDGSGRAVFAWLCMDAKKQLRPQMRVRAADGTLSPTESLFVDGPPAAELELAVNPIGHAIAIWTRDFGIRRTVEMRRRSAGGALSSVTTLSPQQDGRFAKHIDVAMDPNGGSYAAWDYGDSAGSGYVVQGRRRAPGGALSAIVQLSKPTDDLAYQPAVGVDAAGTATIAWVAREVGEITTSLNARRRSPAGGLSAVQTIGG